MPSFRFAGPGECFYPETRDAYAVNVGAVRPGEVREFDAAPDQWWTAAEPAEGGLEQPDAGEEMRAVEHPADGSWSPPVSSEPAPEPQPAPPAASPATPFAVTTT